MGSEKAQASRSRSSAPARRMLAGLLLIVLAVFLLLPPWSVLDKAHLIGYGICHQIPARSFHPGGQQLPLCARCTGTYLGATLAFATYLLLGRRRSAGLPPLPLLTALAVFIVLMGIDGLNSYLTFFPDLPHLYEPSNLFRLVTGTLNGLALATIVFPVFNFTLWRTVDPQPVLRNFVELAVLLVAALTLVLVTQAELDFLLYPLALLSTAGVLAMLTLINSMILLIMARGGNVAETWGDALLPLLAGLTLSVLEIAAMGAVRALLTRYYGLSF
ncbi:MAG: DUF2085 domain-containing protein [Chloroflexota bacterium]